MRYVNITPAKAASILNKMLAFGGAFIEKIDAQTRTVSVREQEIRPSKNVKVDLSMADMVRRQAGHSGGKGESALEVMESIGGQWQISYSSI